MTYKYAITVILLVLAPTVASTASLDAPIDQKPTIRSEIHRGAMRAFDCHLANLRDNLQALFCTNDAISAETQKNTITDAFQLGLHLESVDFDPTSEYHRARVRELEKALHVTHAQACEVVFQDIKPEYKAQKCDASR
jgi:phosphoenolpyruvate carboxylase